MLATASCSEHSRFVEASLEDGSALRPVMEGLEWFCSCVICGVMTVLLTIDLQLLVRVATIGRARRGS